MIIIFLLSNENISINLYTFLSEIIKYYIKYFFKINTKVNRGNDINDLIYDEESQQAKCGYLFKTKSCWIGQNSVSEIDISNKVII